MGVIMKTYRTKTTSIKFGLEQSLGSLADTPLSVRKQTTNSWESRVERI